MPFRDFRLIDSSPGDGTDVPRRVLSGLEATLPPPPKGEGFRVDYAVKSTRQRKTEEELAEYFRREAAYRKTLHGRLANRVLAVGRNIKTEKMSYRALQRRYGRSVGVRAPGMFVSILCRKAESAGGKVVEFPTPHTKLSQVCHGCGTIEKKPLSQRIHACTCGIEMQRDLYSAFLARCVGEDQRLHADRARKCWSGAEPLLRAAWSRVTQPASGRAFRPSSFGALPRSRSGSPAEGDATPVGVGYPTAEAPDVVAATCVAGESRREAPILSDFVSRTPRL